MIFLEPLIQLRFICEDAASSRPIRRRGHWLYQHTQIGISGPEKDMLRIPINPRILRFSPKSLYWLIFEESVNMNQNEEVPESLGGLGDLLPADVLKMVNELLEQLHRKDKDHQGSIVLNIYEKGSLHVDHVDNQNFYGDKCLRPTQQEDKTPPTLPPPLSSPEAMAIWQKVREAGYVDENYQPLISRTQSALLANAMATRLGIRKKWKVFETLWHRTKMYKDYYQALDQQQSLVYQDKLKQLFD